MMKFFYVLLFLMPLSFIGMGFWFNQCLLMITILLFFSQLSYGTLFCGVILLISLFCTFASLNLFVFYLFFEMSLIPTLILIVGWEYQPERIQAGVYLLFYSLIASLPMMV